MKVENKKDVKERGGRRRKRNVRVLGFNTCVDQLDTREWIYLG